MAGTQPCSSAVLTNHQPEENTLVLSVKPDGEHTSSGAICTKKETLLDTAHVGVGEQHV